MVEEEENGCESRIPGEEEAVMLFASGVTQWEVARQLVSEVKKQEVAAVNAISLRRVVAEIAEPSWAMKRSAVCGPDRQCEIGAKRENSPPGELMERPCSGPPAGRCVVEGSDCCDVVQ